MIESNTLLIGMKRKGEIMIVADKYTNINDTVYRTNKIVEIGNMYFCLSGSVFVQSAIKRLYNGSKDDALFTEEKFINNLSQYFFDKRDKLEDDYSSFFLLYGNEIYKMDTQGLITKLSDTYEDYFVYGSAMGMCYGLLDYLYDTDYENLEILDKIYKTINKRYPLISDTYNIVKRQIK